MCVVVVKKKMNGTQMNAKWGILVMAGWAERLGRKGDPRNAALMEECQG